MSDIDYEKLIADTENQHNLQPGVLKRLIQVESSGNIDARSPSGAIGLTQLLPGTAKELGVDPNDPIQNIQGGAKYLRKNLDKFNGDYGQALAGYNAGPNHPAVVNKDWDNLPEETKKYTNQFLDFIQPKQAKAATSILPKLEGDFQWEEPKSVIPELKLEDHQWEEPKPVEKVVDSTNPLEAAAHGFTNLGTAGFMDEIVGGAGALGIRLDEEMRRLLGYHSQKITPMSESYKNARDLYRKFDDQVYDEHPISYGTGAAAGMAASPVNKIFSGKTLAKAIGTSAGMGAIFSAGDAKELSDIPGAAATGAATGAVAGGTLHQIGSKLAKLRDETLIGTTNDVLQKKLTNTMADIGGVTSPDVIKEGRDKIIQHLERAISDKYNAIEIFSRAGNPIKPDEANRVVQKIDGLDRNVLNELNSNDLNKSGIEKIRLGQELTGDEAASLYKNLTKLTSNNTDAQYLINNFQKYLEQDMNNSGSSALKNALEAAKIGYAKKMAMESFKEQIDKHIQPMPAGSFMNYMTFNNALKSWIANNGHASVEFNPEIKQAIENFRATAKSHPELRTLIQPPNQNSILETILGKTPMDFAFKHAGAAIGAGLGGPFGAAVGEGTQLTLRGISALGKSGIQAIMKSPLYEPLYRKQLEALLNRAP